MGRFLSKKELLVGKINGKISSLFYPNIERGSSLIGCRIFDKNKLFLGSSSLLYNCRIRICTDSKYVKIGRGCRIENNVFLNAHTGSIDIGNKSFIGPNTTIQGFGGVKIGNDVMIAGNSFISSSNHLFENVSLERFLKDEEGKATEIGSNTWIGSNVTIVAGVKIGERCVIGAGSVVTKDIPENSVAVGVPAKVIKKINIDQ